MFGLVALDLASTATAGEDDAASRLVPPRLSVVAPAGVTLDEDLAAALRAVRIDVRSLASESWAKLDRGAVDAILLPDDPAVDDYAARAAEALAARGTPLVVVGRAARAAADDPAYSRRIGRVGIRRPAPPGALAVAVVDQRHPVTQCVPHLLLPEARVAVEAGGAVRVVARAISASPLDRGAASEAPVRAAMVPAMWTVRTARVAVGVIAIELPRVASTERARADEPKESIESEPAVPSERADLSRRDAAAATRALVAALTARFLELVCERYPTAHLPADLPLAAWRLGPNDVGILPGVPAARGFYRGRQIAPYMTFHGADWLERAERSREERPDEVVRRLRIAPGSVVVDLGAGTGYFSRRLARAVGPTGRVLAVEIQREMLERLVARLAAEGITNVEPILATAKDPRLPVDAIDLVLLVDVYHELSDPAPVLAGVRRALRRGDANRPPGRLVLVEYRGEDPSVAIKPLHRMTEAQARAELEAVGYRWVETLDFLPLQHVLVFERSDAAERERKGADRGR